MFDVEEDSFIYHKALLDALHTMSNRQGFENFLRNLYCNVQGQYLGPEEFNRIDRPTASQEARDEVKPAYQMMLINLAKSLGEPTFKAKWMEANSKGFDNLLIQLEEKGPNHFINKDKDYKDLRAGKGGLFWDAIIKYIKHIGSKGFQLLVRKVEALPKTVTSDDILNKKLLDIDPAEC